jgi:hypothetical protein
MPTRGGSAPGQATSTDQLLQFYRGGRGIPQNRTVPLPASASPSISATATNSAQGVVAPIAVQGNQTAVALANATAAPLPVTGLGVSKSVVKDSTGNLQQLVSVTFTPPAANYRAVGLTLFNYHASANPFTGGGGFTSPVSIPLDITNEVISIGVDAFSQNGVFASSLNPAVPTISVTLDGATTAPPAPSVATSLAATPTGYQFSFNYEGALLHDIIQSYNIYRNTTNTSSGATFVKNVPQPSANSGVYTYQETVPNGTTYYYFVSSLNLQGLESTKTAMQSGTVPNGSLLNSAGQLVTNQVFGGTGNNTGSSAWFKLGTWIFASAPASIALEFQGGTGYNSNAAQQSVTDVTLRSSNATAAPNLSGITWQENGGTQAVLAVKAAATGGSTSVSNNSWDIYVQFANFSIGTLVVSLPGTDTWTQINSVSSDPGAASSTVVVGTGGWVGNVGGNGLNGVNDGPSKFAAQASGLTYRPTSNPLTATDAGANATINVAAFVLRTSGNGDINISSGSVTALSYSTLYYVYFDDATLTPGAVTFNVTTTKATAINSGGRFFVGSIVTPAATGPDSAGNNDGGVGAQAGQTSVFLFGAITPSTSGVDASTVNLTNSIDGNLTTFGSVKIATSGSANASATGTTSAASPTSAPWSSLTLFVRSAVPTNNVTPGAAPAAVSYSTDGGSTFTTIWSVGASTTRALQTDSVSLPLNMNLANLRVQATVFRGSTVAQAVQLNLYEAYVIGLQ